MDLIGIPIRITVGKKVNDNLVEIKHRTSQASEDIEIKKVKDYILEKIKSN